MFAKIKRFFGFGCQKQQEDEHQPARKKQKVESPSCATNDESNDLKEKQYEKLSTFLKELEQVFKREKEIPTRFVQSLKKEIDTTMNLPSIKTFVEQHIHESKEDDDSKKLVKLLRFCTSNMDKESTSTDITVVLELICDLKTSVDEIVDDLLHALNCDEETIEEVENFIDIYPKHLYIEREYSNESEEDEDGFLSHRKYCKQLPVTSFYDYSTDTWWANRTIFVPTLAKRMAADTGKFGLYDRLEVRDSLSPFHWPVPIHTLMNMNCGMYIDLQNELCSFVIGKLWDYELLDSDAIDYFDLLWHSSTLPTFKRFSTLVSLAPELMKTYRYQGYQLLTAKLKYDPVAPHLMGVLQTCLRTHPKELGFLFEEFEDVESDSDEDDECESDEESDGDESDDDESDDDGSEDDNESGDDVENSEENSDEEKVDDNNEDGNTKDKKEPSELENIDAEKSCEPKNHTQEDNPPKKKQSAFNIAMGKIDETMFLECVEEQLELTNCPGFYEINKETNTYPFFQAAVEGGDLSVLYYLLRRHDDSLFLNATTKK